MAKTPSRYKRGLIHETLDDTALQHNGYNRQDLTTTLRSFATNDGQVRKQGINK
jgi:hypothetical protein